MMRKPPALTGALAALVILAGQSACTAPTRSDATRPAIRSDEILLRLSTADGQKQFSAEPSLRFAPFDPTLATIEIEPRRRHQQIVGFGAAITDASAWLIQQRMNAQQRTQLLQELFGRSGEGLGLSFTRLTIGASDFSLSQYSLDDVPRGETDPALAHFSIDPARENVLPVTRQALQINPQLRVMASPWSAPAWMKSSDNLVGGTLRADAYAAFAEYLVRYVEAVSAEGVPIYALTVQNEPGFTPGDYPGMLLLAAERAQLIGDHLGPLLAARAPKTRLLDWDHNWDRPYEPLRALSNPKARPYIAGVAWHCYEGDNAAQIPVHDAFPDKEVYLTECSGGEWTPLKSDTLMVLTRNVLVGAIRGDAKGVLLWNLALDENRGPHTGGCSICRGLVTIDSRTGNYSRTIDYTVLAHASRYVRPGAWRVDSSMAADLIDVAFVNDDDGSRVLIVANSAAVTRTLQVRSERRAFRYDMPGKSVATFVWK